MRIRIAGALLAPVLLIATACGTDHPSPPEKVSNSTVMTAQGWIRYQQSVGDADYVDPPRSFRQALAGADLVVLGKIADVQPGRGYYVEGDDAAAATPTAFADGRVSWRSVHGRIDAERVLRGNIDAQTVSVGFTVDGDDDFAPVAAGIKSLGRAVFFLFKSPVYDYKPGLYGALLNGSLVATVDTKQRLHLPLMTRLWNQEFLSRPWSLAKLIALASAGK